VVGPFGSFLTLPLVSVFHQALSPIFKSSS
jgi:hypothetical protein